MLLINCNYCLIRETRQKIDIDFEDSNDTVKFQQQKTYFFNPELSNGTLDDNITMPNVPLLVSFEELTNVHVLYGHCLLWNILTSLVLDNFFMESLSNVKHE